MAALSTNDSSSYWAAPARNFRTSARLHLQHLLFQNSLGYVLESRVHDSSSSSTPLRVADLACGNAAWLIDLDRELSKNGSSAILDGYDINSKNFPAAVFLPSSITLKEFDILAEPPPAIVGTYDVVHVRAFVSLIVNSNVTPLLSSAMALLKPGGWLQWEEIRADQYVVESPSPDVSKRACETITHILKAGSESRGLKYGFLGELDRILKDHEFIDVHVQAIEKRKHDYKAWTEDYLMIWEELGVFFPSKAMAPEAPMTKETWAGLFEKAVSETELGVVVHQGEIVSVAGRKAL